MRKKEWRGKMRREDGALESIVEGFRVLLKDSNILM